MAIGSYQLLIPVTRYVYWYLEIVVEILTLFECNNRLSPYLNGIIDREIAEVKISPPQISSILFNWKILWKVW